MRCLALFEALYHLMFRMTREVLYRPDRPKALLEFAHCPLATSIHPEISHNAESLSPKPVPQVLYSSSTVP